MSRTFSRPFSNLTHFCTGPVMPCRNQLRVPKNMLTFFGSFGGQAPLALICLTAVTLKLKADPPRDAAEKTRGSGRFKALLRTMDWLGAIFSALCITIGLGTISLGGKKLPWSHPIIIVAITVCVLSATFFVLTERYYARKPLIPPKLITQNGIGAICVIQILLCAARFGVGETVRFLFKFC